MKGAWSSSRLGDVCTVIAGQSPKGSFYNDQGEGLPFYQGKKEFTERLIGQPKKWTTFVTKAAVAGDILMSVRAPVGPINQATEKICIGRGLAAIRPNEALNVDYLWYALTWLQPTIIGHAGAVFESVNKAGIELLRIPLPPLEEQRRIVAVLDEAFEGLDRARAHAELNLQDAHDIFRSSLSRAFNDESTTWIDEELTDLGVIQTGSTPKTAEPDNLGEFIPFIKPGDFKGDGTLVYDNQGLSEKGVSISRIVPPGSAMMVCIGATIGKTGFTDREITTNQQINSIIPRKGVSGEYLYHQMLTPEFQAAVVQNAGQATLPIINKKKWSKLRLKLPSDPELQHTITDKLRDLRGRLDQVQAYYRGKLADLDDLRQSILQRAFAGELT